MANIEPTSDIYFSWSRNIALGENATPNNSAINLVTTSNRYGLVFTATESEIKCISILEIQKQHSVDKNLPDSKDSKLITVPAGGLISGLFLSADESVLAVCAPKPNCLQFCHLFDIRAFSEQNNLPIGPFHSFPLSNTPNVKVVDFSFNPVIIEMFAVVTSDGIVTNYEIGYQAMPELKIQGKLECGAVCCSWSPKGKQLVIAKTDGSLAQLKPQMIEAKAIPAPQNLTNPKPKAIYWAASTVFVVAYWTGTVDVFIFLLQKNQPTTVLKFDEPCLRNLDEEFLSRVWFCHIPKWNFLVMTCRNSSEVALFKHSEDRLQWTYLDIEERRACLPIVKRDQTYATGASINFSSTIPVEKKNEGVKPPSPILLLSSTIGTLVPFYIINCAASGSITENPEVLRVDGMRKMLQPLTEIFGTPRSSGDMSKLKVNLLKQFEQSLEEQEPSKQAPPESVPQIYSSPSKPAATFAVPAVPAAVPQAGGSLFSQASLAVSQAPALFAPMGGSLPTFGATVTSQKSLFGQPDTTKPVGLFGQPAAPKVASLSGQLALGDPTKAAPFNFSFGNIPSPSKPAAPVDQSTPFKPQVTFDTGPKAAPPPPFPGSTAAPISAFPVSTAAPIASFPGSTVAPVLSFPSTTTFAKSEATKVSTIAAPSVQPVPPTVEPPSKTPTKLAKPQDPSKSLKLNKSEECLSQETLSKAFFDELNALTNELNNLKTQGAKVLEVPIGSDSELNNMRNAGNQLVIKMDTVKLELKSMKDAVQDAEKVILDALACSTQLKKTTASKESRISRMDPVTESTLKQARALTQYLERQLVHTNTVLDDAFNKFNNEKSVKRRMPTIEMLCRTIISCEKTIEALRSDLGEIRTKVEGVRRLRNLRDRNSEDLTSLADSLLQVGISSKQESKSSNKPGLSLTAEKVRNLREYLTQRAPKEVTPTKSSAKGDSMIVSKLSMILEQSRIDAHQDATRNKPESVAEKKIPAKKSVVDKNNMPRESIGGLLGLRSGTSAPLTTTSTPIAAKAPVRSAPTHKPIYEPISPPPANKNDEDDIPETSICKPFSFSSSPQPATSTSNFSFSAPNAAFKLSFGEPPHVEKKVPQTIKPVSDTSSGVSVPEPAKKPMTSTQFPSVPSSLASGSLFATKPAFPAVSGGDFSFSFGATQPTATAATATTSSSAGLFKTADFPKATEAPGSTPSMFNFTSPKEDAAPKKTEISATIATTTTVPFSFTATPSFSSGGATGALFGATTGTVSSTPFSFTTPVKSKGDASKALGDTPESPKLGTPDEGDRTQSVSTSSPLSSTESPNTEKSTPQKEKQTLEPGTPLNLSGVTDDSFPTPPESDNTPKATAANDQIDPTGSTSTVNPLNQAAVFTTASTTAKSLFAPGQSFNFGAQPTTTSKSPPTTLPEAPTVQTESETDSATSSATNIFAKPVTSGGLFGKQSSGGLFGSSGATAFGAASSGTSFFGGSSTSGTTSLFGTAPVTTAAPLTTPATLSGDASNTSVLSPTSTASSSSSSSIFSSVKPQVSITPATSATNPTPVFGSPSTFGQTSAPAFGSAASAFTSTTSSSTTPAFGSLSTTTTSATNAAPLPAFGTITTPPASTPAPAFGTVTTPSTSAATPAFGNVTTPPTSPPAPVFGSGSPPSSSAPALAFGTVTTPPTSAPPPAFGTATTPSSLVPAPAFGSSSLPSTSAPAFGSTTSPVTPAPAFGSPPPAFGSANTPAPGIFGQSTTSPAPAFGAAPTFGTQQAAQIPAGGGGNGLFGKSFSSGSGSLFGQKTSFNTGQGNQGSFFAGHTASNSSGFMGGLGQQGSTPTKNIFGGGTFGQSNTTNSTSTNLFGAGGATTFGGSSTFGQPAQSPQGTTPAFGGSSFAQNTPSQTSAFGKPPSFGSPPGSFGSPPVFGGSPSFASQTTTFGNPPVSENSAFANAANAPTFGSLAQSQPTFGSPNQGFGGGGFGGTPPTPGFGNQPSSPPQGSAFTQYRG